MSQQTDKAILAKIRKCTKEFEIPVDEFHDVIDIDEDEKLTIIDFLGESDKEKIQSITLLSLLAYQCLFDRDYVESQEIRRIIDINKISLNNFSRHINDLQPTYIRELENHIGPRCFRLTSKGAKWAKQMIKEIGTHNPPGMVENQNNNANFVELLDNIELWEACRTSFENKEYWNACLLAFIHLETKIREKSELTAKDIGTDLVSKAFKLSGGILKIPSCEVEGEEEGFLLINMGIVKFHRNPKGHRKGDIDRKNAAKIICYVDYLLEILKTSEKR